MHMELSDQERARVRQGEAMDVVDPLTDEPYVLLARDRFEPVRALVTQSAKTENPPDVQIPEGIRVSQEAFRRALPGLLQQKKLVRHWAAYHRDKQIGIADTGRAIQEECFRLGLDDNEYYIGWIDPCELIEEEEIESRLDPFESSHEAS